MKSQKLNLSSYGVTKMNDSEMKNIVGGKCPNEHRSSFAHGMADGEQGLEAHGKGVLYNVGYFWGSIFR